MPAQFEVSQVIDRPLEKVFDFVARQHVRNHPRWDPDIELEQISEGPLGLGTMIRRRNRRSGTPVEGTMEVVEFEPDRAFATIIHDGPVEIRGRMTFEAVDQSHTRLTTFFEMHGVDESRIDRAFMMERLEHSGRLRKELIESET
jgi:uncharacterized protein YndB with AHSA1/START domain